MNAAHSISLCLSLALSTQMVLGNDKKDSGGFGADDVKKAMKVVGEVTNTKDAADLILPATTAVASGWKWYSVRKERKAKEAAEAKKKVDENRKAGEKAREDAKQALKLAVAAQKAADVAKAQAKADREAAEAAKVQAAEQRRQAESASAQAVVDRKASEEARAQAKAALEAAEAIRAQTAEDRRVDAEVKRRRLQDEAEEKGASLEAGHAGVGSEKVAVNMGKPVRNDCSDKPLTLKPGKRKGFLQKRAATADAGGNQVKFEEECTEFEMDTPVASSDESNIEGKPKGIKITPPQEFEPGKVELKPTGIDNGIRLVPAIAPPMPEARMDSTRT